MNRCFLPLMALLLSGWLPLRAQLLASSNQFPMQSNRSRPNHESGNQPVTLKVALTQLEQHYHVSFIYPTDLAETPVTAPERGLAEHRGRTIADNLAALLGTTGLAWRKVQTNVYAIVAAPEKNERPFRKMEPLSPPGAAFLPNNTPGRSSESVRLVCLKSLR